MPISKQHAMDCSASPQTTTRGLGSLAFANVMPRNGQVVGASALAWLENLRG